MPGKRRTREQRAKDRAEIARLATFGAPTQRDIAEKMGLDQATVSRELKAIRDAWAESAKADVAVIIAAELQKLDRLEVEALAEWERSKKDYTKKVVEDKPTGKGGSGGRSAKIETGGQCGDPRYLNVLLGIQERRAKLLGTDKPAKVAPVSPDGTSPATPAAMALVALPAHMSPEEWAQAFSKPSG